MRPTTYAPLALLAILLSLVPACSSTPRENDAADQKAWGTKMAVQGFWREALFRYQRAASLRPDDPEILSNLAVAFEATGEPARALAAYRRALELAPEDQKIKRNYARFAEYYTSAQRAPSGDGAAPKAPEGPGALLPPAVPPAAPTPAAGGTPPSPAPSAPAPPPPTAPDPGRTPQETPK